MIEIKKSADRKHLNVGGNPELRSQQTDKELCGKDFLQLAKYNNKSHTNSLISTGN
jgi:hypothetical protein